MSHIQSTLDDVLSSSPNAFIILAGDFKHFKYRDLRSSINLRQLVKDPTRGQNILDFVLTNPHKYYKQPEILPPIWSSDHNVTLLPSKTTKPKGIKPRILIRDTCNANRQLFSDKLKTAIFTPGLYETSCEQKYELFHRILNGVIDETLPFKSLKSYSLDKPWVSAEIKEAIVQRQKIWKLFGPQSPEFRSLRNKINRLVEKLKNVILMIKLSNAVI